MGQIRKKAQLEFMAYDWYLIEEDDRWSDKWLITYLDDASRFVVGYGVFDESTTYSAILDAGKEQH